MLLLVLIVVVLSVLWGVVDNFDGQKAWNDFCTIECRQNLIPRCKTCD